MRTAEDVGCVGLRVPAEEVDCVAEREAAQRRLRIGDEATADDEARGRVLVDDVPERLEADSSR